jgi:hypothetical protein
VASPRHRFDLIINQFVLDAYTKRELLINLIFALLYPSRMPSSFCHRVAGARRALPVITSALKIVVTPEIKSWGWCSAPGAVVGYKDMTFRDVRDITVSYEKIQHELGFQTRLTPDDGIREVLHAIRTGVISNPNDQRYRNAQFIVQ